MQQRWLCSLGNWLEIEIPLWNSVDSASRFGMVILKEKPLKPSFARTRWLYWKCASFGWYERKVGRPVINSLNQSCCSVNRKMGNLIFLKLVSAICDSLICLWKVLRKGSRLLLLGRVIFARLATDGCGFMCYAKWWWCVAVHNVVFDS